MVYVQSSTSKDELPPDAIVLTKEEALDYRQEAIKNLDWIDTWPLVHGRKVLALTVGAQGAYILHRFRRKLRLGNYGILAVTLPFAGAPALLSTFHQQKSIVNPIILENECSICRFTRLVFVNTLLGCAFSGLGGGVASLWYAHNLGNYTLPPRKWSNLLVFGQHVLKLNKPLIPFHWAFFAFNIVSSYAMITLQERSMQKVNQILAEKDFELAKKIYLREKQKRYKV